MTDRSSGIGSGDPATPDSDDPRGEDLASVDLPEPGDYTIADDETEAEELQSEDASGDDAEVEIDDPEQLADAEDDARSAESTEPETLVAQVRSARPARKAAEVTKKGTATPSRRKAATSVEEKRATPRQFVGQSVDELKKVVWPTPLQVRQYFAVVLVFVLFIMAYVVALDTGFGALLLKLLG